jgi:hypothetical protein
MQIIRGVTHVSAVITMVLALLSECGGRQASERQGCPVVGDKRR